jgi:Yip1 domain
MQSLVRLALSGLLLERPVFRELRDAPDGLRRGLLLVLAVGLAVGLAALIGSLGASLINPAPAEIARVLYEEISATAWFTAQASAVQEQISPEILRTVVGLAVPGLSAGLMSLALAPLFGLLAWLFYGLFAHLMARLFGGRASLSQTLSCTALASGAQLLGLGQLFPVALVVPLLGQVPTLLNLSQALAVSLLSLLGNYLALREAHELAPWRAFWAAILGPFVLLTLFGCGYCALIVLALGAR